MAYLDTLFDFMIDIVMNIRFSRRRIHGGLPSSHRGRRALRSCGGRIFKVA